MYRNREVRHRITQTGWGSVITSTLFEVRKGIKYTHTPFWVGGAVGSREGE